MNPLTQVNPLCLPIFAVALVVAIPSGRASVSGRRVLAVLFGILAGYGVAVGVNAILISLMSWHQLSNGAVLNDGDIMTGLMIAGAGVGLVTSLFIRDSPTTPGSEAPRQQ